MVSHLRSRFIESKCDASRQWALRTPILAGNKTNQGGTSWVINTVQCRNDWGPNAFATPPCLPHPIETPFCLFAWVTSWNILQIDPGRTCRSIWYKNYMFFSFHSPSDTEPCLAVLVYEIQTVGIDWGHIEASAVQPAEALREDTFILKL